MTAPPSSRTLGGLVHELAECFGHAPALVHEQHVVDWALLQERVGRLARGLGRLGLRPGDRVAVLLGNSIEWILCDLGAGAAGAVFVGLNTWYREPDLAFVLSHCGARAVICADQLFGRPVLNLVRRVRAACPELRHIIVVGPTSNADVISFAEVEQLGVEPGTLPAVRPNDPANILYTSGSTARPKGVVLHHGNLIENGLAIGDRQHVGHGDVLWLGVPLFFSFGAANALMVALTHGVTVILQDHFDAGHALDLIAEHGCSMYYGMPHMTQALIDEQARAPRDIKSLVTGLTLGPPEAIRMTAELVPGICNIYGLTETYGNCAVTDRYDDLELRATSQGEPLPGFEVRVVEPETGEALPPGEIGRLMVRGRVFSGYYGDAEATAAAFSEEGWFDTGDLGSLGPDNRVRYAGRLKEMIKVGGINVSPLQVEEAILGAPGVRQAHVVGCPHPDRGEVPVAFVEWKEGAVVDLEAVLAHCRRELPSYAVPLRIVPCRDEELPRTATGKVRRLDLVERLRVRDLCR